VAVRESLNFLLSGVGGQGAILASDVLVHVGLAAGFQAKQAEVHGMSQRGGSVTSHVRWGKVVYSPLVGAGEFDVYLAFEKVEALRHLGQLRPRALVVVNMQAIEPVTVTSGTQTYPDDARLRRTVAQVTDKALYIDGSVLASALGNVRAANVVLLGALSALIEREGMMPASFSAGEWMQVIAGRVPSRHLELNRAAFQAGRDHAARSSTESGGA
jgi:indolepyruvate ferredoxin oxidoreductase, beta subunit